MSKVKVKIKNEKSICFVRVFNVTDIDKKTGTVKINYAIMISVRLNNHCHFGYTSEFSTRVLPPHRLLTPDFGVHKSSYTLRTLSHVTLIVEGVFDQCGTPCVPFQCLTRYINGSSGEERWQEFNHTVLL